MATLTDTWRADNPELWHKTHELDSLTISQWDDLFMPGIGEDSSDAARQYVLQPVDGSAKYVKRSHAHVDSRKTAQQDVEMDWPEFAVCLTQDQATNVTLLLQEVNRHQV